MARLDLENLEIQPTLRERSRDAFWALLRLLVVCYVSWDLSAYLIRFWETGNPWRLITPSILAVVLVYTLQLADLKRRWWLVFPMIVALGAPIVLHSLDQRVQPNSRLLSDAYESVLDRAPKPGH